MVDKLKAIAQRLAQVEESLADPAVYSDREALTKLSREQKELTPVVEVYRALVECDDTIAQATEMLSDSELRELAQEELQEAKARREELLEEVKILLLPRDPNDNKNVVLEIRAGIGGEEGALFAADLLRMYTMDAERRGFSMDIVSINETELGGVKEVVATVEGAGAYSRLKFEAGTHRVQRVPATESQGRIQTSAATVAVLPEVKDVEIEIKDSDLIYESCKSSGAGGQHINKTESAVRLTHKPTGIVIECQQERSQFQNKDKALEMLRAKLYHIKKTEQDEARASARKSQVGSGDRSEKIRTYNYPQSRVTDHRIGLSIFDLDGFMNGNIGAMIEALTAADTAEKLKEQDTD